MKLELIEAIDHVNNKTWYYVQLNGRTQLVEQTMDEALAGLERIRNLPALETRRIIFSETIGEDKCPA